jgi:hypothetical protein
MNNLFKILLILLLYPFLSPAQSPKDEILNILSRQTECWNRGDIECFMEGYWKSDELKFIGKNGVTMGWQSTLDNYKNNYPSKKAMGELSFDILEVTLLDAGYAYVVGKWHLERHSDELSGHFTLLWKKLANQWVIISDHSSG